MSREFNKPFITEFFPCEPSTRNFVYPREMLIEQDIFPFMVLDGGAFFFMTEAFGDATSATLLEKTMSGELFDILRTSDGRIDWGISYHTTDGTAQYKQHELQSWPQRLYMLLPLAQEFMRTHDKKYADKWIEILKLWVDDSPYEEFQPEIPHVKTSMKWRDMQVSWRTITLIHSVYMLGTYADALSKEDWKFVYDFIDLNLSHLVLETKQAIKTNRFGNHVLQMGSALISAGILLYELPRATEYLNAGRDMMKFCVDRAIFADGGSNESSPSYSHFIARLYLEAASHIELNGYEPIDGLRESVERQYNWLAACSTLTGRTLRLSDSYSMDAHKDIENMAKVFGMEIDFSKKSVCLSESGFVMLRCGKTEAAIDAMGWYGGHQHYGRLQLLVFHDGEEILCDSGCTSYDNWDFYRSLYASSAHNVVYLPEIPDGELTRTVEIEEFKEEVNAVGVNITLYKDGVEVMHHKRAVVVEDGKVSIMDTAMADGRKLEGAFHLPGAQTVLTADGFEQLTMKHRIKATLNPSRVELKLEYKPARGADNRFGYVDRISYTKENAAIVLTTIEITDRA